jgi:hypothetical protein
MRGLTPDCLVTFAWGLKLNRRSLPHKLHRIGYVPVRNPDDPLEDDDDDLP